MTTCDQERIGSPQIPVKERERGKKNGISHAAISFVEVWSPPVGQVDGGSPLSGARPLPSLSLL